MRELNKNNELTGEEICAAAFDEHQKLTVKKGNHEHDIQKKQIGGSELEVIVRSYSVATNTKSWTNYYGQRKWKTTESRSNYDKKTYCFYRYSHEVTAHNANDAKNKDYRGKTVTVLFPKPAEDGKFDEKLQTAPTVYGETPFSGTRVPWKEVRDLVFYIHAPFIIANGESPEVGELALIRSAIFGAFEQFAKEHPDIAYKYIPIEEFLTTLSNLNKMGYNKEGAVVNHGIFFRDCRVLPTDDGRFISPRMFFNSVKINANKPKYKLRFSEDNEKHRKALGDFIQRFFVSANLPASQWLFFDNEEHKKRDKLKQMSAKILLWDYYGDEVNNMTCQNVSSKQLVDIYFGNKRNYYVSLTSEMFRRAAKPQIWNDSMLQESDIEYLSKESLETFRGHRTDSSVNFDGSEGFVPLPNRFCKKCYEERPDIDPNKNRIGQKTIDELLWEAKYRDYDGDKTLLFWSGNNKDGYFVVFGEKGFARLLEVLWEAQGGQQ